MSRLPIRARVTLVFTGAVAVVLLVVGLFLYVRLGDGLDASLETELEARAAAVARAGVRGDPLAQVFDASGALSEGEGPPLLSAAEVRAAAESDDGETFTRDTGGRDEEDEDDDERLRLLAVAPEDGGGRVVVVGSSLEDRDDAVESLGGLLLLGGPAALLFAALAGYVALTAALRPVESMRRRAASIGRGSGERLPVATDDEIGRLGTTLNEMLARLEDALARERTFVADASHELRTPLSILKAELELALRSGRSREELEEALRSAAEETDRLVALAEDLLVVARADQGGLAVRRATVDLAALARRVAGRAGVEVDVPEGLSIEADAARLEQALGNLVDNAVRHGGSPVVVTARREAAHEVVIAVADAGPGFPEGFLPQAFERFTRADAARGRGGAGLGLAIVAAIAAAHGGRAEAVNRQEGGAEVRLRLPGH